MVVRRICCGAGGQHELVGEGESGIADRYGLCCMDRHRRCGHCHLGHFSFQRTGRGAANFFSQHIDRIHRWLENGVCQLGVGVFCAGRFFHNHEKI